MASSASLFGRLVLIPTSSVVPGGEGHSTTSSVSGSFRALFAERLTQHFAPSGATPSIAPGFGQ